MGRAPGSAALLFAAPAGWASPGSLTTSSSEGETAPRGARGPEETRAVVCGVSRWRVDVWRLPCPAREAQGGEAPKTAQKLHVAVGPCVHAALGAPRSAPDCMLRGSPAAQVRRRRAGRAWSPGLAVLMTRVMSLQRHRRLFVIQDSLLTLGLWRCPRNSVSSVVCVSDDRVIVTYSKGHQCGDNKTASAVIELTCAKTVGRPSFTR